MTAKIDVFAAAPSLVREWQQSSKAIIAAASLEPSLMELVQIRASQINGCANCINIHVTEAREQGEAEQRIDLLAAWQEAPCYSERERAALAWTEAMTRLSERGDRTEAYAALRAQFSEEEQVKLTLTINVINGWNRAAVGFGIFVDPAVIKAAGRIEAE